MIPSPEQRTEYHRKLDEALLEGFVTKARFTDYEMGYTTGEGAERHSEVQPLHSNTFEVEFSQDPQWPPITRVESARLRKRRIPRPVGSLALQRAVVIADSHYPFESEEATMVALQIAQDFKPHQIIHAGDLLDMTAWSEKFVVTPEFANSTQEAMIAAHGLLRNLKEIAPQVVLLEGNHSERMKRLLLRNAQAAYNLRKADEPEGWPVMSMPNLLSLDRLGVEWVGGYPANRYFINERLQIRHGTISKGPGKTAAAVAMDERISTITGHKHTIESSFRTINTYGGGRTYAAHTIGCLCLLDGSVPGAKSGSDNGQNIENYLNWQNGLALVEYEPGDGVFDVQNLYMDTFNGHRAHANNRVYKPDYVKKFSDGTATI